LFIEGTGQQTSTERCIGDDGDAELATRGQQVVCGGLDVEIKRRVLDLDGVDLADLACATEGVGADFGQANAFNFSFAKSVRSLPG
jgi:hypothetical protein